MNRFRYYGRVVNYLVGFSVYGLLCLLMMPIAFLLLFCPADFAKEWGRFLVMKAFAFVRWWCRKTSFVDMRLIDHTSGQHGQLLVANHLTMFDIVLLFGFIPKLQSLVNAKFARNPLMYLVVKACRYIPIEPGDAAQGMQAFGRLEESLLNGEPVALFPEGTRSANGNLGRLKKGAFRLAEKASVSFVYFRYSQPFLNKQAFFPRTSERVVLEAHVFEGFAIDGDWELGFRKGYEDFIAR